MDTDDDAGLEPWADSGTEDAGETQADGSVAPDAGGEETTAEPPAPIYTVTFSEIDATSNGYGSAGSYGSTSYAPAQLYFIGIAPQGSGYFKVYDTGATPAAGVSGSDPNNQSSFAFTSFNTAFSVLSLDVYNPGVSAVDLAVGGWSGSFTWNVAEGDVINGDYSAAPGWSTIELDGFTGIASLTIDFPDGTPLYFNTFLVQ